MGLTLAFGFLSFPSFSSAQINTHDIGHTSVYGLEIALHGLQLLKRALLYMWYFNGFKQTNTQAHRAHHRKITEEQESLAWRWSNCHADSLSHPSHHESIIYNNIQH